jgi:cupin fold WbuC family metalloprotein
MRSNGNGFTVHRHKNTAETYILLRGRLEVLIYDENGNLTETVDINPNRETTECILMPVCGTQ